MTWGMQLTLEFPEILLPEEAFPAIFWAAAGEISVPRRQQCELSLDSRCQAQKAFAGQLLRYACHKISSRKLKFMSYFARGIFPKRAGHTSRENSSLLWSKLERPNASSLETMPTLLLRRLVTSGLQCWDRSLCWRFCNLGHCSGALELLSAPSAWQQPVRSPLMGVLKAQEDP